MIVIISSEPGMGKTFKACEWEEPILYLDLENRVEKTIKKYYSDRIIALNLCLAYTKDYKEDHVTTLKNVEKALNGIKECATVVIDGISDLRDYAHTAWAKKNNKSRAVNPGDWEEINDIVRDILFPLINQCRKENIHLVMTAQFKDDYEVVEREIVENGKVKVKKESVKRGRVPALKEWQAYNVDTLITLIYDKDYYAVCTKSIVGCWSEKITGKSLFEVLEEKEIK